MKEIIFDHLIAGVVQKLADLVQNEIKVKMFQKWGATNEYT